MTKVSGHTYKVTIRLKSSGQAGTVTFKVSGRDTKGGSQSTTVTLPASTEPRGRATAPDRTGPPRTIPDRDHRAVDRRACRGEAGTSQEPPMRTVAPMTARPPHARPAVARSPARAGARRGPARPRRARAGRHRRRRGARPADRRRADPAATLQPTVQYEEAVAHAGRHDHVRARRPGHASRSRRAAATAGPSVACTPRALPAGRLSGTAMRATSAAPGRKSGATSTPRHGIRSPPVGPADLPYLDPAARSPARRPRPSTRAASSARSSASCRTGS